ncbi:MAG: (d)CMP kinase, partial [Alistipes sp.]|nr:(d)CMP kinase [Candidatus Minthomonas equi]
MKRPIIIAIDGHSSTGKSTVAKLIAGRMGYIYIDTGALYRALALGAMREGMISPDGEIDELALSAALTDQRNEKSG